MYVYKKQRSSLCISIIESKTYRHHRRVRYRISHSVMLSFFNDFLIALCVHGFHHSTFETEGFCSFWVVVVCLSFFERVYGSDYTPLLPQFSHPYHHSAAADVVRVKIVEK